MCRASASHRLLLLAVATVAAPPSAWAKKMTLPQLLEMARGNPGLQANAAAIAASEAQVTEAKLNWLPQGDLLSILAPSPNISAATAGSGATTQLRRRRRRPRRASPTCRGTRCSPAPR